jgi:hypothetical protein
MPFHTSGNNVVYSSPTWTQKFVESNIVLGDTIASGAIAPFSTNIGKYERICGTINVFYSSDNNNEIQFRIVNKDKDGAAVASSIKLAVFGAVGIIGNTGAATSADVEGGVNVSNTGTGNTVKFDSASDDSPLFFTGHFSVIVTAGTHGTLEFQASNVTAATGAADILAGSYISYRRF